MELIKKNINVCRKKQDFSTQTVVNEDLNLPDYMEDIEKVILEKGEFYLEQVRALTDKIIVKGKVKYHLLYSGGSPENISSFIKETAVNEEIHADGVNEYDEIIISPREEAFNINIINSRKINVKMIIGFDIYVQEIELESITTDISADHDFQLKRNDCTLLKLCLQNNDIYRFHNQRSLAKDKPNIEHILYDCLTPREIELKCGDGCILISGRMHVFIMYYPEGKDTSVQCFEYEFPIDDKIDCPESMQGMIGDLRWSLSGKELEIKEDNENEARVIAVSGVIDIGMNIFSEEQVSGVEDAYAIGKLVQPKTRAITLPKLLMKNNTVCRVNKRMRISDDSATALQVCHIEGDVRQEKVFVESDMMVAEGHVFVKIIYVTNDEQQPFRVATGAIAYSHSIEVGGINDGCRYRIKPIIESITASLEGNDVEIHIQIAMDVIVFDCEAVQIIDDISVSDIPKEHLKAMPGIVGYMASRGENLWDIAKKYQTTVDRISDINKISDEPLKNGQKLLIIKEIV